MFIHFGYNLHFWLFSGVGKFFWIFKGIVVSNKQLADGTVLSNSLNLLQLSLNVLLYLFLLNTR